MSPTTQPDLISFVCWNCERGISVAAAKAGRRGRCPQCRAPQRVPGGAPPARRREPRSAPTPTRAVVARSRAPRPRPRRPREASVVPWLGVAAGFAGIAGLIALGLAV